jgi:hypothetical protein
VEQVGDIAETHTDFVGRKFSFRLCSSQALGPRNSNFPINFCPYAHLESFARHPRIFVSKTCVRGLLRTLACRDDFGISPPRLFFKSVFFVIRTGGLLVLH